MANAIRVHSPGGPEKLVYETYDCGQSGKGEVLLKQSAVGLNFIDVYHRTGMYLLDSPFVPGMKAAGTVTQLGSEVTEFAVGDRVAYAGLPVGAYCDERTIPAHRLVKLPDEISFETGPCYDASGNEAKNYQYLKWRICSPLVPMSVMASTPSSR